MFWSGLKENFARLLASPRELWMAYLLKFLESYAYFSMSVILVLYLTEELGLTDFEAGVVYGLYGLCTSGVGLAIGFLVDNLGVRLSLIVGFTTLTTARFLLAVTSSKAIMKFVLYGLLPLGTSLGIPVLAMGIKRYTTPKSRGFAFGLFYTVMNVGALLSGLLVDVLELRLKSGMVIFGAHYSSKRLLLLSGVLANFVGLVISLFFREIKLEEGYEREALEDYKVERASPLKIIRELASSGHFWRFMGITVLCVNLRMLFRYLDALLPPFLVREFGNDVHKGTINAINPAIIITLVPVVAALTTDQVPFSMIHFGSYISGVSALPLALHSSISSTVLFMVLLSIGEAIWSPRFYDLTVSMAPEGREGTFVALGTAPMFLAKFPVGLLSGHLLATYCPKEGPRHPQVMWLIIFCMTMSSPILLTCFRRVLRPPEPKEL